jgi:hypothetical protein
VPDGYLHPDAIAIEDGIDAAEFAASGSPQRTLDRTGSTVPYRLVADIDIPLKQETFDLPQRQRIANGHHQSP